MSSYHINRRDICRTQNTPSELNIATRKHDLTSKCAHASCGQGLLQTQIRHETGYHPPCEPPVSRRMGRHSSDSRGIAEESEKCCFEVDIGMERENFCGKKGLNDAEEDCPVDFFMKTDEEARTCYYNKLIQMKILNLAPSKKSQNIIIFDWDDTLLCTSYLINLGIKTAAPSIISVLNPIDNIASKLLSKTLDLGHVFIITNAEQGWVQSSARKFLPKTFDVMQKSSINIISARANYEEMFPGENERWKREAFTNISKLFKKDITTNLICIGDSNAEIDAAHVLAKQFDSAIIKTIKFKERPMPEELRKQQFLLLDKFDKVFVSLRDSSIKLERKAM